MSQLNQGNKIYISDANFINKVRRKLQYIEDNIPTLIKENEEKLYNSTIWTPAKIKNSVELNSAKSLFISTKFRNEYMTMCFGCKYGSLWKLGFSDVQHVNNLRCSNSNCESTHYLPLVLD
jgi:hypothetical protein